MNNYKDRCDEILNGKLDMQNKKNNKFEYNNAKGLFFRKTTKDDFKRKYNNIMNMSGNQQSNYRGRLIDRNIQASKTQNFDIDINNQSALSFSNTSYMNLTKRVKHSQQDTEYKKLKTSFPLNSNTYYTEGDQSKIPFPIENDLHKSTIESDEKILRKSKDILRSIRLVHSRHVTRNSYGYTGYNNDFNFKGVSSQIDTNILNQGDFSSSLNKTRQTEESEIYDWVQGSRRIQQISNNKNKYFKAKGGGTVYDRNYVVNSIVRDLGYGDKDVSTKSNFVKALKKQRKGRGQVGSKPEFMITNQMFR